MISAKPFLLSCTALFAVSANLSQASAAALDQPFTVAQVIAQAQPQLTPAEKAAREKQLEQQRQHQQQRPNAQTPPPQTKPVTPPPAVQTKPVTPQPPAAQTKPVTPQPPAAQTKPVTPQPPAAQTKPVTPQPPAAQTKPVTPQPPAAQTKPVTPQPPAAQTKPVTPQPPAAQTKPVTPQPPAAQTKPVTPQPPAAQTRPITPQPPAAAVRVLPAPPPPTKPTNANEFVRRDNSQPQRGIADLRKERQEVREGDRVVIREGDRTIVRVDNRVIINHNESTRFAVGARNVRTERRGNDTVTIIERAGGISIVTFTDRDGRLLRRIRRDREGREVIIIDNSFARPGIGLFINLGPPVIRIPRDRYIVEVDRAPPALIFETFMAPPVERIETRYTLDQVRYSEPLRARMPRVDLSITFDTGSWTLSPDQVNRLAAVADGLNRAIAQNPREVFMIEGHTDAVGDPEDNLSLSDRRAESVAVALTETFHVPAENLVTQGYGAEDLKVPTQGPERANRYVAVRRITPLIDQVAGR